MFEYDICLCGNSEMCPYKDKCERAVHRVGIHTYSNLYKLNEECGYFLPRKKKIENL